MILIPKEFSRQLTELCILVEQTYTVMDVAKILVASATIKGGKYDFPEWLSLMIEWKKENPMLSTEEAFIEKYCQGYGDDYLVCRFLGTKYLKPYTKSSISILRKLILEACGEIEHEAFKQALWAISLQILGRGVAQECGLQEEWHRKCPDEYRGLEYQENYKMFKAILIRESEFWQYGPSVGSTRSSKSSINPKLNPDVLNAYVKNKVSIAPKSQT